MFVLLCFFFFFQAEDGIRDVAVTEFRRVLFRSMESRPFGPTKRDVAVIGQGTWELDRGEPDTRGGDGARCHSAGREAEADRSEERRVGKECRSRWSA